MQFWQPMLDIDVVVQYFGQVWQLRIEIFLNILQVEEKPDVTYSDVGGCKEQIDKLREVVETPLLHVSITPLIISHYLFTI